MNRLTINHVGIVSALALHALLLAIQVDGKPVEIEPFTRIAVRLVAPNTPTAAMAANRAEASRPPKNETENQSRQQPVPAPAARPRESVAPAKLVAPVEKSATLVVPVPSLTIAAPVLPQADETAAAALAVPEVKTAGYPAAAVTEPAAVPVPVAASRLPDYLAAVRSQVENHKDYPAFARQLRQQGTVLVRVAIGPEGRLLDAVILNSSGHHSLDKAALAAIRNAGRFRSPEGFGLSQRVTIDIPITYKLI